MVIQEEEEDMNRTKQQQLLHESVMVLKVFLLSQETCGDPLNPHPPHQFNTVTGTHPHFDVFYNLKM